MLVHSRELAIVVIIILLAAAGSQLPRLVRAFGEVPRRAPDDAGPVAGDDEAPDVAVAEDADDEQAGSPP